VCRPAPGARLLPFLPFLLFGVREIEQLVG
jgi:hypothetical protein